MKPEPAFIAERPLVQHCPELLRAGPSHADLSPSLKRFGQRLSRALTASFARLWNDDTLEVRSNDPRECSMADLADETAPLAANAVLCAGMRDARFLASVEADAVLRLVDRAFGGKGEAPSPLPEAFPLSAELMIARLESAVANAIARTLEAQGDDAVRTLRRDSNLKELTPFADDEPLLALSLTVEEGERKPWQLTLAFPAETLDEIFGSDEQPRAPGSGRQGQADPRGETFGDIPLTLSATLVDMRIPFSSLSALQAGQVLPVAVARNIPITIGDKLIAHGTVGEMDDRVAVQVTQAF